MRALADIASMVTDPNLHADLVARGQRLFVSCEGRIQNDDLLRLRRRLAQLQSGEATKETSGEAGNHF